ncbi:MAG: YncE family protein [Bernardetiaceae bacterium]|nr:YncE family protein [Bernardetiaceae bacterium]
MKNIKKTPIIFAIFAFCLLLIGCAEESLPPQSTDPTPDSGERIDFSQGIFVVNEGNFGWGHGSISFIDAQGKAHQEVFRRANEGQILGNVAQSMSFYNEKAFIVVNNSQLIEVVDRFSLKRIGTIEGLRSPRYILPLSESKAYVTDMYEACVWIVNPQTLQITGRIDVGGWCEQLIVHEGKVYVCNFSDGQLIEIDPNRDEIITRHNIGLGATHILLDANKKIWILCNGNGANRINAENPELYQYDPTNGQFLQRFVFPERESSPGGLCISPDGQQLFFINGDIFRLHILDEHLPTSSFVPRDGRLFYSLGISSEGLLYAADAIDYVQDGNVFVYNIQTAALLQTHKVGVIPTQFQEAK